MSILWRFTLMGGFKAEPEDKALADAVARRKLAARGGGRKGQGEPAMKDTALLAYLAAHAGEPLPRAHLIETFWRDQDFSTSASDNLRTALSHLRAYLEPTDAFRGRVLLDDGGVTLNPATVASDWGRLWAAARAAQDAASPEEAIRAAEAAVEACHGDLLDKRFERYFPDGEHDWLAQERERLRKEMEAAFCRLSEHYSAGGDMAKAITCLSRAAGLHPESDVHTRELMRLLAASGRGREVWPLYTSFRDGCKARSTKPSDATSELAKAIKAQMEAAPWEEAPAPEPPAPLPHAPLKSFIGRAEQLAQLRELLCASPTRLVTLLGMGGCGKTRLAVQAGEAMRDAFPGGFHAVYLEGCASPDLIANSIRDALRLPRHGSEPPFDQVTKHLRSAPTLLLLDNMEHLLGGLAGGAQETHGAVVVRQLMEAVPSLRCIVTSRQALEIGEKQVRLGPLRWPGVKDTLEAVRSNESVRLFEDRARLVGDFQLSPQNYRVVADICRRMDGLPLALEITAAMTNILAPPDILRALKDRLDAFKSWGADIPERHRTLRAAIESSFNTLSPDLKWTLAGLTVFRGGWTIPAVEGILQELRAPDSLRQLYDRSLIAVHGPEHRFHMLETIRDYAHEQVPEETVPLLNRRHAEYYAALAEETAAARDDDDDLLPREPLDRESENVRAALHWLLEREHDVPLGVQMAGAMFPFWLQRNDFAEARQWLEKAVRHAGSATVPFRARAMCGLGAVLAYTPNGAEDRAEAERLLKEAGALFHALKDAQGEACALFYFVPLACDMPDGYAKALPVLLESLALFRAARDKGGMADAMEDAGVVLLYLGDADQARSLLEEALPLCRALGNDWRTANVLQSLGNLEWRVGRLAEAQRALEEAGELFPATGDRYNTAFTLALLGNVAAERGAAERAAALYDDSRHIFEDLKSARGAANVGHFRAVSLCLNEDPDAARALLRQSLRLRCEGEGDTEGQTATLRALGIVAARLGESRLAAILFGAVERLRETAGADRWPPLCERTAHADAMAAARAALNGAFQTTWDEGRAMPTEKAIALALGSPA